MGEKKKLKRGKKHRNRKQKLLTICLTYQYSVIVTKMNIFFNNVFQIKI
jgi:hypothetical protein